MLTTLCRKALPIAGDRSAVPAGSVSSGVMMTRRWARSSRSRRRLIQGGAAVRALRADPCSFATLRLLKTTSPPSPHALDNLSLFLWRKGDSFHNFGYMLRDVAADRQTSVFLDPKLKV